MEYLIQVVKGIKEGKKLPSFLVLKDQYSLWKKYLIDNDVFKNAMPWLTFSAINFLKSKVTSGIKVFEFGGGGSTLFFAQYAKELVTVEHDQDWFKALKEKMDSVKNVQWRGNFIQPERGAATSALKASDPNDYYTEAEEFKNDTFVNYANFIDSFNDNYFDIVLVDGRSRPSCLKHSLSKVKVNGYLVLDNADRKYYLESFGNELKGYELVCNDFGPALYIKGFTQTNIWRRVQ